MNGAAGVRVMSARFASTCGCCGLPIRKGASIQYRKGAAATHAECTEPVAGAGRGYGLTGHRGRFERCEDAPCCGCCS